MSTEKGKEESRIHLPPHGTNKSKYAIFDQEKRRKVIFWVKVTSFSLGFISCAVSFFAPSIKKACIGEVAVWRWCLLVTTLLAGLVLSQALHKLMKLLLANEFSLKENAIYYVLGTVEGAWVFIWCAIVLVAWTLLVKEPSNVTLHANNRNEVWQRFSKTTHIVTLTLIVFLMASFLSLIKNVFLMVGKSSFHIRRFFDRVRKTLKDEYMIKELRKIATRNKAQNDGGSGGAAEIVIHEKKRGKEPSINLTDLEEVDEEHVSCWGMQILIKKILQHEHLPYTDEHSHQETLIKNESDAITVARDIYANIFPQQDPILEDFFERADSPSYLSYSGENENTASQMVKWLHEGSNAEYMNEEVFCKCMVRAWMYRRSLVRALHDNRLIFKQLNRCVNLFLSIIMVIIWLIMIHAEVRKAMVLVGSFVVGSAFLIADFAKKLLDCFVFVFIVHPYDVGDCCLIEDTLVIIHRRHLLSTVAFTLDNERRQYPNDKLCALIVTNYTRSPPCMGDSVVFFLDLNTPDQHISYLKSQIKSYIEKNKHQLHPEHGLVMELESQGGTTKIKATLKFRHKITIFYDFGEMHTLKTKLVAGLKQILHDIQIPN